MIHLRTVNDYIMKYLAEGYIICLHHSQAIKNSEYTNGQKWVAVCLSMYTVYGILINEVSTSRVWIPEKYNF